MRRILEPGQIEALWPKGRFPGLAGLPGPDQAVRGARQRPARTGRTGAPGQPIGDYLR